mgnify:CR=1 FL=1
MLNRICQILSIVSFVMVASMSGGAYFGYKYVTSENFKAKVMKEIMGNVSGLMPKVLDKGLPSVTGPSIPTKSLPKL